MKINIEKAIEMAKKDPNSEFAVRLRNTIESGKLDMSASKQGVDLTRFGRPTPVKKEENLLQRVGSVISDIPSDIKETVQGVRNVIDENQQRQVEVGERTINGEQENASGGLQFAGNVVKSGSDLIGEIGKGVIKLGLRPEDEQQVKQMLVEGVQKYSDINVQGGTVGEAVKELESDWDKLAETNPEIASNLVAIKDIGIGALDFVTGKVGGTLAKETGETIAEQAVKTADSITKNVTESAGKVGREMNEALKTVEAPIVKTGNIDEALKSTETGITSSNVDPIRKGVTGEENLLTTSQKRRLLGVDTPTGNKYMDILAKSEDFDNVTGLFDQATEDTLKVIDDYKKATNKVGSDIGRIKEKLATTNTDKEAIKAIKDDLVKTLEKENVFFTGKSFATKKGKTPTLTDADIKTLNRDVVQLLENVEKSKTNNELIIAMKALDNKINYNLTGEATGSLKNVSKKVRAELKKVRDNNLSLSEAKRFEEYSEAQSFIEDFAKSENKVSTLLNRFSSMRSKKSLEFAEELKRVTGIDVQDYAELAKILTETTAGNSRNRSLLKQHMGDVAEDIIRLSPTGLVGTIGKAITKGTLNVDKLKEIKKAIDFIPTKNTK